MTTRKLARGFNRFAIFVAGGGNAAAALQHHWGAWVLWTIFALYFGITGWPDLTEPHEHH